MKKTLFVLIVAPALLLSTAAHAQRRNKDKNKKEAAQPAAAATPADTVKPKKPAGITDKVKSSRKIEGMFTLYQDTATGSIQLYIRKDQLDKEFIYQSFSISGPTSLYLNQSMHRANFVFKVQKAFDKLEFAQVNTSFYYDPENPVSKTAMVDKPEAIILSEKITAHDDTGYLVPADPLFISEKMDPVKPVRPPGPNTMMMFNLGNFNPGKSKYHQVRSFPDNTDVIVDMAYDNPAPFNGGGPDITDARYIRVRMQHSFIAMPENNYRPRRDDPRVGFFIDQVTDQTSIDISPYKDMIHRWHLEKKDPSATLSEPVEPIVYWVENTTPHEYRQIIVDAGHKWNEAFEKAGFKNAVQMKIMPDDADWDPADIRYNVIRWVSSAQPSYGAIGPSFVNPKTGQILGADITVEWFSGSASPIFDELFNGAFGATGGNSAQQNDLHFPGMDPKHEAACTLAGELKAQLVTGTTVLDVAGAPAKELKKLHEQFLVYLIMHEMGHTLGLNHNMKASQMLSPEEIHNTAITHKIGLIGSVMDYPAINISSDPGRQGDYYTTKAGPYDLWAIEYGYTPFSETEEEAALNKILSRSTDPKLAFGNDGDDMRAPGKAMDPRVNINELTSDAIGYAEERFKVVNQTMGKLVKKYSKPGQSYAELRARYSTLHSQRFSMIAAISRYVGGIYVDRSYPEQKASVKPFTPVSQETQKRAVAILNKYVFAPNAFDADVQVFPYLQPQRRGYNQSPNGDDYRITGTVLSIQINGALSHLLHPATLQRMTNSQLYGNKYSVADLLNDLQKGIFDADISGNVNVYRQYLQTAFVKGLISITEKTSPHDDIAKAGALNTLKKIKSRVGAAVSTNEETKAHRGNIVFLINNALENK